MKKLTMALLGLLVISSLLVTGCTSGSEEGNDPNRGSGNVGTGGGAGGGGTGGGGGGSGGHK